MLDTVYFNRDAYEEYRHGYVQGMGDYKLRRKPNPVCMNPNQDYLDGYTDGWLQRKPASFINTGE